jgi:hypothetical protein
MTMAFVHDTCIHVNGFLHIHPTQNLSCITFFFVCQRANKDTETRQDCMNLVGAGICLILSYGDAKKSNNLNLNFKR